MLHYPAVPGIQFDAAEVGEVQQCWLVVTDDIVHVFVRAFAVDGLCSYKVRYIFTGIFMKKATILNAVGVALKR